MLNLFPTTLIFRIKNMPNYKIINDDLVSLENLRFRFETENLPKWISTLIIYWHWMSWLNDFHNLSSSESSLSDWEIVNKFIFFDKTASSLSYALFVVIAEFERCLDNTGDWNTGIDDVIELVLSLISSLSDVILPLRDSSCDSSVN